MIGYTIILGLLLLMGCQRVDNQEGPLSRESTNAIKGLGILVVFVDHISGYYSRTGASFPFYGEMKLVFAYKIITTLMVALFLFFSGYGVTSQILNKGNKYVRSMPKRRIFTTFVNFDIAVFLFLITDYVLGLRQDLGTIALSLIAWDSLGNSNWYIFAIIFCYLCSYIANIFAIDKKICLLIIAVLLMLYCCIMSILKDPWWYQTILAYVVGCSYCTYEKKINKFLQDHYVTSFSISLILFIISFRFYSNAFFCNISTLFLCTLVVLICQRISLKSSPLVWCGQHLFSLYIYQRLPMLIISFLLPNFIRNYPYGFFLVTLIITLLIARFIPQFKLKNTCQ